MLNGGVCLRACQVARWSRVIFVRQYARTVVKIDRDLESNKVLNSICSGNRKLLCDQNSQIVKDLGEFIASTNDYRVIKKVKDEISRILPRDYEIIKNNLINLSNEPFILNMIMFEKISKEQYESFLENLRMTINDKSITNIEKLDSLYKLINCQSILFPKLKKGTALVLPDDIHKWFYQNIEKNKTFNHYHFLIENNVSLSSSVNIRKLTIRLLQGSDLEKQLVTFQFFLLRNENNLLEIQEKFISLHNFYDIYNITNTVLKNDKEIFTNGQLNFYLQSVVEKLILYKDVTKNSKDCNKKLAIQFVHFIQQLLIIISKLGDIKLFVTVLKSLIIFMKNNKDIDQKTFLKLLHRPIINIFALLRLNKNQDAILALTSVLSNINIEKNYKFKSFIINELILSLRYFDDPKLICQFFVSAIKTPNPVSLLNDLGIWGSVFHSTTNKISNEIIQNDINNMTKLIPDILKTNSDNLSVPLSELYRVILKTNSIMMKPSEYREFIVTLYINYINFLKLNHKKHYIWKLDTSILKHLLTNIISNSEGKQLAYEILINFYSHKFSKKIRNKGQNCPFSIVLYYNHDLSQIQVAELLNLMDENNIPLSLKICTSMIFRYLKWGDIETAHTWYQKILYTKYSITNMSLIRIIQDNKWEFPTNFDINLLSRKDRNGNIDGTTALTEEETDLLIQESDETLEDDIGDLIDLVKTM